MVIKIIGYFSLILLSLPVLALVPVEGIIMGEAKESIQSDPLHYIFRDIYDHSQVNENKKVKQYYSVYKSGAYLTESCHFYGPMTYAGSWGEKQAKRSVASTVQYIGLDTSIKAIGAYAKKLGIEAEDFKRLSRNLLQNYCSKNLTTFSLRNIEQSLQYYYTNPATEIIPSVLNSPFATNEFKNKTEKDEARSVEMEYAIKNFRAFCSWGGDVGDYRMMGPYLKNQFIMAFVVKNLLGVQDTFDEKKQKVETVKSPSTVQVTCEDLICRRTQSWEEFERKFPLSVGASGLDTDLAKLYCNHFRYQDYVATDAVPQVKQWIKESELEDPIFETNFFLSIMTGVPDPMYSTEKYIDLPLMAKSSIDERWTNWANDVLNLFSKDLMFEESLKIRTIPLRDKVSIRTGGLKFRFSITLGELDRVMDETDKLRSTFTFKLSKNYLRSIKTKWNSLKGQADFEGQKNFKKEMAQYLNLQLEKKEKLFLQKIWNADLSRIMAEELLEQVLAYEGTLFDSYKDEMLIIPVEFNYGLFAMSYLRFRADVNADRLKFRN